MSTAGAVITIGEDVRSSQTIDAARRFLAVACEGQPPTDAALSEALDHLLSAYHATPDPDPSDSDKLPPDEGETDFYQQLGKRFPDYGYYPVAFPMEESPGTLGTGDAIDDLGDIILDMRGVLWLADNVGVDDAHWYFRLHFFHWGTHARDLLRYLHGRQFGI
jgi:hypothetical protein